MMDILVSVVIPTYERPDMLERAIKSVLAQRYLNFEILVIDDNGDGSEYQLMTEEYMKRYEFNKSVRYLKHKVNLGGCAARNTGIRNAKGKFIGFLDDDDEWNEKFLIKLLKKFTRDEIGAVYCKNYIDKKGKVFYSEKIEPNLYRGQVFEKLLEGWCPTSTSLFIVRKECFEQVGTFDERLISFQDYDMWLRVAKQYDFDYVDERLIIKHEEHGGEQVGFNPYKREKALVDLKNKWESKLTKEEKLMFHKFCKQHSTEIQRNMIIYNKQRGMKCNYFKLYKNFLDSKPKIQDKILLLLIILFGVKIITFKDQVIFRFLGKYKFLNS